jgi:hypothetical protein
MTQLVQWVLKKKRLRLINKLSYIKLLTKTKDVENEEIPDSSIIYNYLCYCKFLPIIHSYLYYREK